MWRTRHFGSYPYEAQPLLPNRTKAKTAARVAKHRPFGALRSGWCGILLASSLCACTVVDTIDPRIDLTNRQTARARDQAVLLNIVRANHNLPLNFVAFSRVSGTQSASLSLASPTFLLGPGPSLLAGIAKQDALINNTTLSTSGATSNAFDLTVLDSKDFYSALLSPVELPTLEYFERQGYSRELLFWMFTDSVRVRGPGIQPTEFRNDLNYHRERNVNCGNPHKLRTLQCFDDMVDIAVLGGLRSESRVIQKPSSGREGGKSAAGSSGGQQKLHTVTYGRLCFDTFAAIRAGHEYDETLQEKLLFRGRIPHLECGSPSWNPEKEQKAGSTDTLRYELPPTSRFGKLHFEIVTRSTFGIYQFLGSILHENMVDQVKIRGPKGYKEDPRLLVVRTFPSPEPCFVELAFEQHEYFCVPQKGAENTKRIFSILLQLIALKTQASDLAITPLVRVTP